MTDDAQEPARQLEELQDQADSLGDQIGDVRDDWETKKAAAAVPGADSEVTRADPQSLGAEGELDAQDPENEDL